MSNDELLCINNELLCINDLDKRDIPCDSLGTPSWLKARVAMCSAASVGMKVYFTLYRSTRCDMSWTWSLPTFRAATSSPCPASVVFTVGYVTGLGKSLSIDCFLYDFLCYYFGFCKFQNFIIISTRTYMYMMYVYISGFHIYIRSQTSNS